MNILEAQELRSGGKRARQFSLPPVGAAPLIAPAGPATAPAAASAPVIPSEQKKRGPVGEFFHDVGQTARAVGTGLYSAAADVLPGQVAKTIVGSDVALGEGGRAQQYAAKQAEDLKRWEMSPEDRENKLFGIVKAGTVQQGLQQIGNSIAPMVAGFGTGAAAASMVDTPASPVADIIGGVIGAGTLTAPMAYRASKADYVLSMRDALKNARPEGTEEEWQAFKASIEDNAKLYGLWEAGPEVVGNMVTMGLLKTGAGSIIKAIPLIESNAARLLASGVAKLALDMPVEVLTESVTGYNQAKIEYASGLRAEPPTPAGAFVEAAPQTIVMTLATMGLGSVANSLMTDTSGQVQRHKIIRLLNKSGVGKETIGDLLDTTTWDGFNASLKKHEAEISKVGADLTAAMAGTPAASVFQDQNAPAVNPLLNPEAMSGPSVFDATMIPPQSPAMAPEAAQEPINPILATPQPTANEEDANIVRNAMAARGPKFAAIQAVDPVPSAATAAVKEVSDKFGIRTIWVSGPTVDGMAVQGAVVGDAPVLLLNTDLLTNPRRDPVMMVYAHELTHRSERVDAKQYAVLEAAVLARPEAQDGIARRVSAGMSEAEARSEAVAEQVEVLGTDQAFWREVFQNKDQSFIEHIIQIITEMAERVFGTNDAAKADAIRGAAVAAFQSLANQNQNITTTTTTQEATNGLQVQGQAQEVAQPLQTTATADAAIQGTPEIKAPPQVAQTAKLPASEVAKLRRKAAQKKRAEAAANEDAKYAEEREARPPPQTRFKSDDPDYKGKPPSSTVWAPGTGLTPIMDEAYARGGIKAKKDKTGGEWDGRRSAYQMRREGDSMFEKPIHGRRRGKGSGVHQDNLSHDMFQHGGMPGELGAERVLKSDQPGALWEQIDEEQKTYRKAMLEAEAEARDDADAKRQNDLWNKHAKTESADSVAVNAEDLKVGDSVVVHGVRMTVAETSSDAKAVRLEDKSGRYGDAAVLYDGEKIYVDEVDMAGDVASEDVPFSTKEVLDDSEDGGEKPETLADTASMIEDDVEREVFARAELEKRAGIPLVQGPKNLAALSQNHVVATAKDLLGRMADGEIDPVEAMESLEAVEKRVGRTVARAESKAAKESKMAGESRQQGLPGLEGLAKSPYGTPDDGASGTLFSAKKLTQEDVEEEGRRKAEASIQSKGDADYLAAVERGDMATAQKIVDEAAKAVAIDLPSAYVGVPNSLMGFRKTGQNKNYSESNFKTEIVVVVTNNNETFVDGMKGLNVPHAMERARRNWAGDSVKFSGVGTPDPIVRDDAGRIIPPSERFNQQSDDIRFSLAKDDGAGREREYSISRYFREELKREWTRTYKQKSAQEAIGELEAVTEKHGEEWVMDHLYDFSKETLAEFPMNLRPLAGRTVIESANKAFRAWGINDDGSNMPMSPLVDKLWLKIQNIRDLASAHERSTGQGNAWLNSTYGRSDMNSPLGVRKFINEDLHKKLSAPVIGPVKAPVIEKALGESKTAYDEAIAALEAERAKNAELEENLRVLDKALGKRIGQTEARIKQRSAKSEAYRRGIDEDLAATMAELKAAGMSMEGLSSKPTIEMIQKAVKLYIGIHGADEAKVAAFLDRNLGEKLAPATVKALINDAQLALDNAGRAAEKAAPRKPTSKQPSAKRKGATVISRAPDMTIKGPTSGPTRLFDSGKMWGEGRVLNIGEADAKRLALELTEAGQTVMRGISSNVEVVISNALRHGRNAAGIEKVLVDSGIDPDTARRMVKNIVRRRAELVRPALETLRQKYAAKGDKVSRTIASAMDKIMAAMDLADKASTSQVSGFFDGNAWDESRRIIEEAFGFKSEITRDWFNETMRLYREYEKADEAGNHLRASVIHSEMLHRVARVQNGTGASLAVRSYIQGGMLWGPQTHWWNFFNTASRNIDAANAASIEQMWKAATAEKGKKLDYLKAAFAPWAIMGMSHKQAWGVSKYILKTGVNPLSMRIGDESKFGTDPKVASAPEWHPFFKKLGMRPFKYVGRALIAADSYFRTNIENTDIYLQAYNAAISRGESAPVAAKQALGMIGFVTDGTNEAYNEAARKADEAGLKGADRDMNIRIELMNKLDPEMRDHAQMQGAAETFNDQNPEGLAGWIADHLRHHSSDPIIFYLGMFARIGANVFNYGLQTNPVTGFLSLAKDSKFGRYKAGKTNVKLTPEERVRRTIRATQGLAMTGTVLAMALSAAKDYDEDEDKDKKLRFGVSAVGPRDPAARKLWRQQHKPFMLTINGKEISYKWIAPMATPLALAGAIMDEMRFGSLKDAETDEAREESFLSALLPTMIFGLMSITTDELPGQGMVKFADMIYSGGQGGAQSVSAWNRFFQQQAASLGTAAIPYSALVRYFDRVYDPTVYTPNSIDGLKMYPYAFLRNMPFLRKQALYPMRNIFGDPIQTPDRGSEQGIGERATRLMFDRFLNNMVEDPDIQFLTKVQRGFNAPSRKETRIVTNENGMYGLRKLKDPEYDRFLEIFGKELRTQIATIRKDYSSSAEIEKWATPQNKALRKRLEDARSTAMNWAMYKYLVETKNQLKVVKGKE